jgi:hypothetical protein
MGHPGLPNTKHCLKFDEIHDSNLVCPDKKPSFIGFETKKNMG